VPRPGALGMGGVEPTGWKGRCAVAAAGGGVAGNLWLGKGVGPVGGVGARVASPVPDGGGDGR